MADPANRSRLPRILSHYRLGELLGSGAMGAVYKGVDRRDRSAVAIKLLHSQLITDESFRERFEREAHVGALLRSPYTVRLLDYGVIAGNYFLVTEYVEGQTLRQALEHGPLPLKRALRIAVQVARALEEAQARGVVHRDIKPDNILLRVDDAVKVSDFGIARQLGAVTVTTPGAFIGTLLYAAPEQLMGKADHRSDLYAVGATLYHLLTGRPPFSASTIPELMQLIKEASVAVEPLAGQPSAVVEIIMRCLDKDPDNRYQSASDLANALEHAHQSAAVDIVPPLVETKPDKPATDATEETLPAPPGPSQETVPLEVPVRLELGRPRPALLTPRISSTRYGLTIRNDGDRAAGLHLTARDDGERCVFSLPAQTSVAPRAARTVTVNVRPRSRRWRGSPESAPFVVSASGDGGGHPPTSVEGKFEDMPYGWVPYATGGIAGVIVAVVLAVALVMGGSAKGSSLEEALESVTDEQLAIMVLTQDDLGQEFADLEVNGEISGFRNNQFQAGNTIDPDDTGNDLGQAGRVRGYALEYSDPDFSPLDGEQVVALSTAVAIYRDSPAASGSLAKDLNDYQELEGQQVLEGGATLQGSETFAVDGLADEAAGLTFGLASGDATLYSTRVQFRLDRLVGVVDLFLGEDADFNRQAEELARRLESRMRGVLLGEITGTPVPIPSVSPSPTASPSPTPSPSPPPTPSLRSGGIAFVSRRDGTDQIYVVNPDGSGETRPISDPNPIVDPDWSPDGKRIAFSNLVDLQIHLFTVAGGSLTPLVDGFDPASSPDGNRIVFANGGLFVVNTDGSGLRRLTSEFDFSPDWSPDGQRIAFEASRGGDSQEIYLMNADGSGVTRLTNTDAATSPDWSPDGTRIAFDSLTGFQTFSVLVMNADGSGVVNLAQGSQPALSPDGTRIAYTGSDGIYVMNADGSGQTRITSHFDFTPTW